MSIADRLRAVRERIAESAASVGRRPDEVTLVAVSKEQPIEAVFEAHDLGVTDFGENTAQGLVARCEAFAAAGRRARWHFIGKLQRNKVKSILPYVSLVHSVDRPELAEALSRRAARGGVDVLVQVNIGREPQKGGVDPDAAVAFARQVGRMPHLRLRGLMGMAPFGVDAEPYFALLAELSRELSCTPEGAGARALSMGMSNDYAQAIRYGATHVRIGTAIFGERPARTLKRGGDETDPH